MEGNSRPAASTSDVARSLDHLVAASLVGQQEFARNLGLSLTDLVCFAHVAEAGDTPVTAGELATRAHVTTGAVTGILNRLERGGFVHRRPDPADRRRVHVVAVPAAAERVRAVFGPYHRLLADSLADHTPDEVALIAGWLDRAVALTRTYVEESC
ncbi:MULTISPECIES: MarR family transcriptional regulator [Streptomyces]|uniref:MarR family transcriptional regulator n=1 Tax=Streptomyces TaxID=1883 RepID=UPI0013DB16D3|nr:MULTISPECIES: MarR family transcriptional regulator [Streptomyces]KAF2776546.1 MarR-family transcriptional regulator [Streptomyces sp. OM5714]MDI6518042.1 MarR family transcriptional regulator [Streptomyces coelicoflavus]